MAFLVLLLLSLTTFIRIETRGAQAAQAQALARQNAVFGLHIALGELQRVAGRDQCISAQANLLNSGAGRLENRLATVHPYWTGIWDTHNLASGPVWLVSGEAPDPGTAVWADLEIELLGRGSLGAAYPEGRVVVERVPIPGAGAAEGIESNSPIGSFAYWVADEGVKASVALADELSLRRTKGQSMPPGDWTRADLDRLVQMLPPRMANSHLLSDSDSDWRGVDFLGSDEDIYFVRTRGMLAHVNGVDPERIRSGYHHLTPRARGVLASPQSGLRRDLSLRPELLGQHFEAYMNYGHRSQGYMIQPDEDPEESFTGSRDDVGRRYDITPPLAASPGQIVFSVAPVITEFLILFDVHGADPTRYRRSNYFSPLPDKDDLMAGYSLYLELWNPYTSALAAEDLELLISGLPRSVSLTAESGQVIDLDFEALFANASDGSGNPVLKIKLPFDDVGVTGTGDENWLPGRVYGWVGPNNFGNANAALNIPGGTDADRAIFYSRAPTSAKWVVFTGTKLPSGRSKDVPWIGLDSGGEPLNLTVQLNLNPSAGGGTLCRIEGVIFEAFDTGIRWKRTNRDPKFGLRFYLYEPGFVATGNGWAKGAWLRRGDPRAVGHQFDPAGQGAYIPDGAPQAEKFTGAIPISFFDHLFDRKMGSSESSAASGISGKSIMEDAPLFELPRQPHLSLGALQHLQIAGARPFSIGNGWGGAAGSRWNRIFDQFFLSGLRDLDEGQESGSVHGNLPHPRLSLARPLREGTVTWGDLRRAGEASAQFFLVEGAFNINSGSPEAWEAILRSLVLDDWEYLKREVHLGSPENGVDGGEVLEPLAEPLRAAFLRFPQSLQEVYETVPVPSYGGPDHPPTQFFRRGMTSLVNDEEAVDPVRQLAWEIALRVRDHVQLSGPFTSLEAFLGPDHRYPNPQAPGESLSLLESAIAALPNIHRDKEGRDVYAHCPAYLSQADMMSVLDPLLNVRSDTFLVRAYGDVLNPIHGQREGVAWCEAVVQRLPAPVAAGDDTFQPSASGMGRRFRVVYLRWLDRADI